jgi:hypothetical protein
VGGSAGTCSGCCWSIPRFGLFVTGPLFVLALAAPFAARKFKSWLPLREVMFCLAFSLVFILFFSIVQYTRLQWVTGIRYLAAIFPFMFLPAALVLLRLPRAVAWGIVVVSVAINWSLAMVRSQGTVFENVKHVVWKDSSCPGSQSSARPRSSMRRGWGRSHRRSFFCFWP